MSWWRGCPGGEGVLVEGVLVERVSWWGGCPGGEGVLVERVS